jgi:hypothetical protein
MAADTYVVLNQNVTPGAQVAVVQDAGGFVHQKNVLETQTGSADPVKVNATNPLPVQGQTDFTAAFATSVKVGGVYNAAPPAPSTGQLVPFQLDAAGNLKINIVAGAAAGGTSSTIGAAYPNVATAIGATDGTNMQALHVDGSGNLKVNISSGGVPAGQDNTAYTVGTTNGISFFAVADQINAVGGITQGNMGSLKSTLDRKLWVALGATTTGGWSPNKVTAAGTGGGDRGSLKGSAGQLGYIYANNTGAGFAYIKLYNTSGTPTPGSGTPVQVYGLPPGGGGVLPVPTGMAFGAGIGYTIVGGTGADADAVAVSASQVNFSYGLA